MAAKRKVSIPDLFKMWHTDVDAKTICSQMGISEAHLRRLIKAHKLPKRQRADAGKTRDTDPTPEEIAQRMLEIRSGWSEREADAKYCGPKRQSWEVPTFHYDAQLGLFSRD